MKVTAFYGSPRQFGNTWHAIRIAADELEKEGIETRIIQVGDKTIKGCIACGYCSRHKNETCVTKDDDVNGWIQEMKNSDGIILGSPVHFSGIGGTMKSFLDRAFFVASVNGGLFRHKVGASVVAVRRSGGVTVFDQLNHFLGYAEMVIPATNYWTIIHGQKPGEALQDEEGVQIMRVLGKNMAWVMKLVENGKGSVEGPGKENKIHTNFIR
jgi:multimeric flavodoxin WrbA